MKICIVPDCATKRLACGFCSRHYLAWREGRLTNVAPVREKRANGTGTTSRHGYVTTRVGGVRKTDHIRLAEAALGRSLKRPEQVHHVNNIPSDNAPGNLVICPDRAYHALLHARTRARDACGNPDWRKCLYCKTYRPVEELRLDNSSGNWRHVACHTKYVLARRAIKRAAVKALPEVLA